MLIAKMRRRWAKRNYLQRSKSVVGSNSRTPENQYLNNAETEIGAVNCRCSTAGLHIIGRIETEQDEWACEFVPMRQVSPKFATASIRIISNRLSSTTGAARRDTRSPRPVQTAKHPEKTRMPVPAHMPQRNRRQTIDYDLPMRNIPASPTRQISQKARADP